MAPGIRLFWSLTCGFLGSGGCPPAFRWPRLPTGVDSWGDDAMGTDILPAGASVNMNFSGPGDAACVYDIKVLGTQGQEGYLYKVDLCTVSHVTFSDN